MEDHGFIVDADDDQDGVMIPEGTSFTVVEVDEANKMLLLEFELNGELRRSWAPTANYELVKPN